MEKTSANLPGGVLDRWGGGQLLAFSGVDGPTPFERALAGRTCHEGAGIEILLPDRVELRFSDGLPKRTFLTGDVFDLEHPDGRTRGVFVDATHLLVDGPCRVRSLGAKLQSATHGVRTLVGTREGFDEGLLSSDFDACRKQRLAWLERMAKPWAAKYSGTSLRTAVKCLSLIKTAVYAPEGRIRHFYTTPDRWPHRGMWLWDSAFNAIGIRRLDPALARDAVEAVLDKQHPDGLVQISTGFRKGPCAVTQPPTLAMAVHLIYRKDPKPDWLRQIYPQLAAYLRWDMANRDSDGNGLLEWFVEDKPQCRCGESGWDNSPRFDIGVPLDAVDFNSFLANECEHMAAFAGILGLPADEAEWTAQYHRICGLMEARFWNDKLGLYVDAVAGSDRQHPMLTAAGFLPLLCGAASRQRAVRLARHLTDPATFGTALPVATVSPRDPHYAKDMWRGPVWVNINWCIARGLERYGLAQEGETIRVKTLRAIERYYEQYGVIYEFYDDEDRVPPADLLRKFTHDPTQWIHQVVHDYTWTATLYLDLLAQSGGSIGQCNAQVSGS